MADQPSLAEAPAAPQVSPVTTTEATSGAETAPGVIPETTSVITAEARPALALGSTPASAPQPATEALEAAPAVLAALAGLEAPAVPTPSIPPATPAVPAVTSAPEDLAVLASQAILDSTAVPAVSSAQVVPAAHAAAEAPMVQAPPVAPPLPAEVPASAEGAATQPQDKATARLEAQLKKVRAERDELRQQLGAAQAEAARLRAEAAVAGDGGDSDAAKVLQDNEHLRATLRKATDILRDKIAMCVNQEKRNKALVAQVASLKEVLAVTRDLLNIRNMEVAQLQQDVDSMEGKIEANRKRQTAMITQMETASKINSELKNEYETQLKIFQSLKERYEEKVEALTRLNEATKAAAASTEGNNEEFVDAQEQLAPSQS